MADYIALQRRDKSWEVQKYKDGESTKTHEVTSTGVCDCKGFEFRQTCRHVDFVLERFQGKTTKDMEEAMEWKEYVYDFMGDVYRGEPWTARFDEFLSNDDGEIYGLSFHIKNTPDDFKYRQIIGYLPEDVFVKFEF